MLALHIAIGLIMLRGTISRGMAANGPRCCEWSGAGKLREAGKIGVTGKTGIYMTQIEATVC